MAPLIRGVFAGGSAGEWRVDRLERVIGETLPGVSRVAILENEPATSGAWILRGVTSHSRYVERREREALNAAQAALGRPEATRAALIPIRKSDAWWELQQDERREIFEARSKHISASMEYLPAVARRLYHSRELGEPFDFLTWFEFAPEHAERFEQLVRMLRATEEWKFVEREVDIRLSRSS